MSKATDKDLADKIRLEIAEGDQSWRETIVDRFIGYSLGQAVKWLDTAKRASDHGPELSSIRLQFANMARERISTAIDLMTGGESTIVPENAEMVLRLRESREQNE